MNQLVETTKQFRSNLFRRKLLIVLLLISGFKLQGQVRFGAPGSQGRNERNNLYGLHLKESWKYHDGDNKQWRSVELNENGWNEIADSIRPLTAPHVPNFTGIAWFRKHVEIDSSMMNVPLLMSVNQYGAMEIYLDGKFLHNFGLVGKEKAYERAKYITDVLKPFAFTFNSQKKHVIAIRYSNFTATELNRKQVSPFVNFEIEIQKANDLIRDVPVFVDFVFELGCLAAIFLTLGLVHFIMFLFYRDKTQNLYYSIYSLCLSLMIFALMFIVTSGNFQFARFNLAFIIYTLPVIPVALIALLYEIFYGRMLKFFWVLIAFSVIYSVLHFYRSGFDKIMGAMIFFISVIEIYRVIIKAIARKKEGAAIFGFGFLYLPFFFLLIMSIPVLKHYTGSDDLSNFFAVRLSPVLLFLALISISISMTVYLARDFARANKKLKRQIKEINELSEKTIQQEMDKKRILENQNVELEKKVIARTTEIVQQNETLETTLQNLKEMQVQLVQSEKMASLGQLTAGVAHEINNPINFVSANISPLKRNFDALVDALKQEKGIHSSELNYTIDETKQLLAGVEEGSRRTAEIVKVLRNFSRLDEEDMKKADINEGINSTLMLLQNKIKHQNIELIKSFGDLPGIECYPGQLNQVFMNILTNAIDAIGKDGKITITTSKENNQIKISFRDTGKGISNEVKQKIFDPFFTTKDVGKGTGLGLSISYGIIKKHKGKIEVESEEGKGTEFIILLPVI